MYRNKCVQAALIHGRNCKVLRNESALQRASEINYSGSCNCFQFYSAITPSLLSFLFDNFKKITPYLSSFHSLMSARVLDAPFLFINAKFLSLCT